MLELLGLICLGLAWLVPNHYPPWSSFYSDSVAAAAMALLSVGLLSRLRRASAPRVTWVLLGVAAIPWIQWLVGWLSYSGDAIVGSLYAIGLAVAVAVGHAWAEGNARDAAGRLAWTILIAALASSVLALIQGFQLVHLGIWSLDALPGMRPYANLGQPNNLATLLGLGAISLLLLREQDRVSRPVGLVLLCPLVVAAALTQSRTALLFGPIIVVIMAWGRHRAVNLKTATSTVALVTLSHWVLTWAWPVLESHVGLVATESLGDRGVDTPRLAVWKILLDGLSSVPWRGFGWLQTGAAQLAAADRHAPVGEMWLQGHNIVIDLLVWCGYPLGLALSGMLVYWYVSRLRGLNSQEGLAGMLCVSLVGAHAMLELPHHYAYFLLPIGLWIGQVEHAQRAPTPLSPRWTLVPAALALLLLAAVWRDYAVVEDDFRLVRFEAFNIGPVRADRPAPDAPFLSSLTAFLRFARTTAAPGMSPSQLDDMAAVVKRYPYASSMARYARALALNGRTDEAVTMFRKIRYIHGEKLYRNLSQELNDRIGAGETGLQTLAQRLAH